MSLIIEYEGGYPFIFLDDDLNLAGVFTEFWTIVAQTLHTEFIFQKEVDSKSTLRNITEERTLTRMDGTKLNADRTRTFAYSNAIRFSIDLLYERQRAGDLEETEISFFTVFKWETIALIFIANLISSIVSRLLQTAQSTIAKFITLIVQVIFLLCLTVIVFHHGAGFQGNNVVIKPGKETSFTGLIDGLHDGSREFWTDAPGFVLDDVYDLLIGSKKIHTVPDTAALLTKICEDPKAVTGMPLNWIMEMNLIQNPCSLVGVKLSDNIGDEVPGLETFAHTFSTHYVFAKIIERWTVYTVNEVLSKLFTQDRIDDFWIPRHAKRLRNFKPPLAVTSADFRPMNLFRLAIIFYVFLGLSIVSIIAFILEMVVPRFFNRDRQSNYAYITAMRTTTRLDGSQLTPESVHQFYASNPIRYSSIFFAERQRSYDLDGSKLTFFTVFRLNSLLLLFVGYIVTCICLLLLKNGHHSQSTPFIRQMVKITMLISLTMVVFHHAAGFRGNNIIKKPGRLTSFSELVLSLRDGTRSFIIPVPDIFNDETLRFLLGDQQLQFVPDSVEVLRQFCAEPSIATLLYSGAYSEMNMIESPCRIAEIKPTEVNGIPEKNFDSYSQIGPSYFLHPKSTHFSVKYILNIVIIRIFPQDISSMVSGPGEWRND